MISEEALVVGLAFAIDAVFGEPPNRLHPVVWMGAAIGKARDRGLHGSRARQLVAGALLAALLPAAFALGAHRLVALAARFAPWGLRPVLLALLFKPTFALRALGEAAGEVRRALAGANLGRGREALRSLCSRDPDELDEQALMAGSIESLAENTSDSVVAPLFWFVMFGIPGAVFYRAVNTLDAMVGYHGKYEWFGKASARLDDLLNLVPARLTAIFLLLAGLDRPRRVARAARIALRDARKTESPNSGWPMAAMAGLLDVALEKQGHYRLGDPSSPLLLSTMDRAWTLSRRAALLAALSAALFAHHAF